MYEITQVEPTSSAVRKLAGPATANVKYLPGVWMRIEASGGAQNDMSFAVQNPFGVDVWIQDCIHHLVTKGATASAVLDIDLANAADGTADTIFDGIAIGSGATDGTKITNHNTTSNGTNGVPLGGGGPTAAPRLWAKSGNGSWLTGKILAAAAAVYVGIVYVYAVPAE